MISVIVPAYNNLTELKVTLPALDTAMKELRGSAGFDVEVIISDDGSQDGTADWIKKMYPAFKYYWHENLGRGPNRNFGVGQAMGSELVFLDSDIEVERFSLVSLLQPLLNKRVSIVFGHIRLFQGNRCSPLTVYLTRKWDKLMLRFSETLDPWETYSGFFAISKTLFEKVQGFSARFDQYGGEDTEFFLRCFQQDAVLFFAENAIGWHHQPLDLKSNLQRIYWRNYSAARIPFPQRTRVTVESTIDRNKSKVDYFFWFMTKNKLWARLRYMDLVFRLFSPESRMAFYFYHFLFREYAEKGYCDGRQTVV